MVSPEIVVKRVSLTSVICWPLREGHRIIMESFLWYIPMTRHVLYKMYNHSPEVFPWYIQDSDIELSRLMIYFYWCFPANSKNISFVYGCQCFGDMKSGRFHLSKRKPRQFAGCWRTFLRTTGKQPTMSWTRSPWDIAELGDGDHRFRF